MAALQSELTKIKARLEAAYNDRLDGVITPEEFRTKADQWRARQAELEIATHAHQEADASYLDEGSRVLELAQRAYDLYARQPDHFERRKLLDLMVSKVVIEGGSAASNLREPFSTLSRLAGGASSQNGCSRWLGC